jgi:MSHA biogenesis protein MshG
MAHFYYEAVNQEGQTISGSHSAELVQEVEKWLSAQNLSPINITLSSSDADLAAVQSSPAKTSFLDRFRGITLEDLILFCRQTATMLDAGIGILQCLTIMAKQVSNPGLKEIIKGISQDIESGDDLSSAFSRHPKIFNPLFINVINIGEESGTLDNSFNYLASLYENEKSIKERIKTATRYPKIVITALFCAVFFLMSFVVPKFVALFERSNVALPLPTKLLITISNFFSHNTLVIIIGVVTVIFLYRFGLNYREFVLARDNFLIKLPIFGELYIKIYMARFCRVFSVLTRSGIDLIKTLNLSTAALGNLILQDLFIEVRDDVEKGENLHESMAKHNQFPDMVVQMVTVGEESGQMDTMMSKVSDYYEIETDYTIKNLSTLLEPILLLFMGVLVGFIALAIFTPMWDMMNVARGGG